MRRKSELGARRLGKGGNEVRGERGLFRGPGRGGFHLDRRMGRGSEGNTGMVIDIWARESFLCHQV